MLNTDRIVRRYTPPTCTLEIQGKSSLLSRWKGSNIVRNLWFQLSFGDRKLPEAARIKICGDRFQLEELCEIVGEYVQQFLSQTSWDTKPVAINSSSETPNKPYLRQKGLLDHELYFSSIAGKKEGKIVKLTSTQLFDLANVLDEFARDITLLPAEKELPATAESLAIVDSAPKTTRKSENSLKKLQNRRKLPSWTATAASFLFASGITFAGMRFYDRYQSNPNSSVALNNTSENPNSTPTPTTETNKGDSVPQPPTIATIPIPSNSLPPSLTTQNTPPPPPTATQTPTTQQQTDINSKNNSTVSENGSNKYSPPPTATTTSKIGNTSNRQKNDGRRRDVDPVANSKTPSSRNNSNSDNSNNSKNDNELAIVTTDKIPELPPSESTTTVKPETTLQRQTYPGYTPHASNTDNIAEAPPVDGNALGITNPATVTAIDRAEQVQQYFKTRWQPPTDLKETLQYNLSISNSGSLLSITPVGKTSATYLDRTNMPLLNESFISPSNNSESTKIRLILNPDGTVQTFQE